MHCEIGGTQGPLGYVSALVAAPSCLRSHNARYTMLKSLSIGSVANFCKLWCGYCLIGVSAIALSSKPPGPIIYPVKYAHIVCMMSHDIKTLSTLPHTGPIMSHMASNAEFHVSFVFNLNRLLNKQPKIWRHCDWYECICVRICIKTVRGHLLQCDEISKFHSWEQHTIDFVTGIEIWWPVWGYLTFENTCKV